MTVLQLVRRDVPGGTTEFDAVENNAAAPPSTFDTPTQHPLTLGSQDLLELVLTLRPLGYKVASIALVDSYMSTVEDPDGETESELIELLNGGDLDASLQFLWNEMKDIYLLHVVLRGPGHIAVTLTQNGLVRTPSQADRETVLTSLRTAVSSWKKI